MKIPNFEEKAFYHNGILFQYDEERNNFVPVYGLLRKAKDMVDEYQEENKIPVGCKIQLVKYQLYLLKRRLRNV